MSEQDKKTQDLSGGEPGEGSAATNSAKATPKQSREDRLAQALRANLRRRKSASRKTAAD